jgi:hypothetical protein
MKTSFSLGPDRLPAEFYKCFWEQIKDPVLKMFENFHRGDLNLSRLNYSMISLIPELKEASNIKQFRPICLLGVDYKWFAKVLTKKLIDVAESIISATQTALQVGRNILRE